MRIDQLIPASQQWFVFTCRSGEFRVLLNRLKAVTIHKARGSYMRLDRDNVERIDLEHWYAFLAKEVIADWDGLKDTLGEPWPCTLEHRKELLNELGEFARFVSDTAGSEENFRGNERSGLDSQSTTDRSSEPELLLSIAGPATRS